MSNQQIQQQIVINAINNTQRGFAAVNRGLSNMQTQASKTDKLFKSLQANLIALAGFSVAVDLVKGLSKVSDSAVELDAKMALVSDTAEDAAETFKQLTEMSLKSGTALSDNITVFTRINKPIRAMGYAMKDSIAVAEALALSLRISGASYQEGASTTIQFSQAMASGVFHGP